MKAFADTFYWVAITSPADAEHARASQFMGQIVTTDEVLSEYLTFFCEAPEYLRRKAAINAAAILDDPDVRVIAQSRASFLAGFSL